MTTLIIIILASCKPTEDSGDHVINKGDFSSVLIETGELQAVNARVIFMPFIGWQYGWQFKITGLVNHGTLVNEGDSIAQFDVSTVKKSFLNEQNKLEVENTILNKIIIEKQTALHAIESQIESLEAAYSLKKLQVEKFKFESEKKKIIKQKELEKAEIELDKVRNNLKLTKLVVENELKIQKIKIKQIENNVRNAQSALSQLTVRSPINGIMQVLENRRTKNIFLIGDEVQQGGPFTLIPDMTKMRVKSSVNEDDYNKVFLGQKVIVRLEAFPLKKFVGKVSRLGKLSHKKDNKSTVKVFDIEVLLDETDPVLKPGMTVHCDIYTSELKNTFFVDNQCIFKDSVSYYIIVDKKGKQEKCIVNPGASNSTYTVISGDIKEGWKIAQGKEIQKDI
ncbi:MAG: efflux RND transporter periplasmic adaptor subunit [Bacteroidales bacterium]